MKFGQSRSCGSQLTQGDSNSQNSGHQSTCRRSIDFRGVLYEAREPFQDAAGGSNIINPHKTASRKGDAPVFLQIKHLHQQDCTNPPQKQKRTGEGLNLLKCKIKAMWFAAGHLPPSHHLQTSSKGDRIINCYVSLYDWELFSYWSERSHDSRMRTRPLTATF